MNKADLKTLARLSVQAGAVSDEVRAFVESLSRADLKRFLFYLKEEMRWGRVRVRTAGVPGEGEKKAVAGVFPGKEVSFERSPSIGAGFQLEYGDDVVNVNIKSMIERAITGMKENL